MRAASVFPASGRVTRATTPSYLKAVSRREVHLRRADLLLARAVDKAVGPEPPSQADTSTSDAETTTPSSDPESSEAEVPLSAADRILALVKDQVAPEVEDEVINLVGQLEGSVAEADSSFKQSDEQLRQLKDQYRRLQADFDNFRSRAGQDQAKSGAAAKARVLEQLLPVIDNFEIASKSIKTETEAEKKINDSYQNLYRQTVEIFRGLGLEAVATVGEQFDPEFHDGVMREDNDTVPDGQVLEELRKGFKYKEELLRPAMVKVAVSSVPATPADSKEEEPAEKQD